MQTIRKTFCLLVAAAILASSFAASVHVHVHPHNAVGGQADSVAAPCSCGFVHKTDFQTDDSPALPVDSPCDHSDCQLCKFLTEFSCAASVEIELDSQGIAPIYQQIWCANYLSEISEAYQGRAPPTA